MMKFWDTGGNPCIREMENKSKGPTFGDFVTIRTEGSIQDVTVAKLQSTRVRLPSPPFFKCNLLRESHSVDSQNIPCATLKRKGSWLISVRYISSVYICFWKFQPITDRWLGRVKYLGRIHCTKSPRSIKRTIPWHWMVLLDTVGVPYSLNLLSLYFFQAS